MNAVAAGGTVRVLVVDDSPVARELLAHVLGAAPRIEVVGMASDGEEAVREAERLRPDVILMDIHLPGMDGFAATRRIMETTPTRIVMATATSDASEVAANFRAIDAGALAVLAKPRGPGHPRFDVEAAELIRTVRVMSEVPVVKRWPRHVDASSAPAAPGGLGLRPRSSIRVVVAGASTGGPIALKELLSALPKDLPAPILVVQHISDSFVDGFAQWLGDSSGYAVRVATDGEETRSGVAYVAPSGSHLQVRSPGTVALVDGPKEHGVKPSVSVLFRSAAAAFGAAAAAVLLTGMGRDGAQELKLLRDGGSATFAQDRESSVVFGMPGAAVALGAAQYVLPPQKIAMMLAGLVARDRMKPHS